MDAEQTVKDAQIARSPPAEERLKRIEARQILIYQVLAETLAPDALRYLATEWNRIVEEPTP